MTDTIAEKFLQGIPIFYALMLGLVLVNVYLFLQDPAGGFTMLDMTSPFYWYALLFPIITLIGVRKTPIPPLSTWMMVAGTLLAIVVIVTGIATKGPIHQPYASQRITVYLHPLEKLTTEHPTRYYVFQKFPDFEMRTLAICEQCELKPDKEDISEDKQNLMVGGVCPVPITASDLPETPLRFSKEECLYKIRCSTPLCEEVDQTEELRKRFERY